MSRRGVVLGVVVVLLVIGIALLLRTDVVALFAAHQAQEPDGFAGQVAGRVSDVDLGGRVLRVSDGPFSFGASAVVVDPAAEVRIDGKIGVLEELRAGARLRVCYEVRGARRFARLLELPPTDAPCPSTASATAPANESAPAASAAPAAPAMESSPSTTSVPRTGTPSRRVSAPPPTVAPLTEARPESPPAHGEPAARRADVPATRPAPSVPAPRAEERAKVAPRTPATRESSTGGAGAPASDDYGAVIDQVLRR
jgi:hypothetical protein